MAVAVSVLMAVRNGERFLDEAVASVVNQTWQELELIVVDDGSHDGTAAILDRWASKDQRVHVIPQDGRGLAASLNRAATFARGRYLARHDADDVSHAERVARQVARLESEPALAAVGSAAEIIDEAGAVVGRLPVVHGREAVRRGVESARVTPVHGSMMVRRTAFAAVGGYRDAFAASQDFDLWLRILEAGGEMDNERLALYRWRRHARSVSATRHELQLRSTGVMLAFAAERRRSGRDSYESLAAAGGDLERFAARYAERGRVHALWGELLFRGLGSSRLGRRHLACAVANGYLRPRSLGLLVWATLGLPWPARRRAAALVETR
jgi:glycosyltransferase involved in cell wall biosynthesis